MRGAASHERNQSPQTAAAATASVPMAVSPMKIVSVEHIVGTVSEPRQ